MFRRVFALQARLDQAPDCAPRVMRLHTKQSQAQVYALSAPRDLSHLVEVPVSVTADAREDTPEVPVRHALLVDWVLTRTLLVKQTVLYARHSPTHRPKQAETFKTVSVKRATQDMGLLQTTAHCVLKANTVMSSGQPGARDARTTCTI